MTREAIPIDISTIPELARLADEVARTGTTHVLRRGETDIAVLTPVKSPRKGRGNRVSEEDIAASLAMAGAWKNIVDTERLKRDLDEARSDTAPPVEL